MSSIRCVLTIAILVVGGIADNAILADDNEVATITGKVMLDGKLVLSGRILFHSGDQFIGAKIKNGEYRIERVPVGTHKVLVQGKGIPERYSSEDDTTLQATIEKGLNHFDLELSK